jgi:DnaK suppressor protein
MDQQILQELKTKLENRRVELVRQLDEIGTRAKGEEVNFNADFPDYGDSAEDNAVEVADYAANLSFEKGLERELIDVEKALQKVADGTYGQCKYCGQAIGLERLKIRPESTTCVNCKKALKGEQ